MHTSYCFLLPALLSPVGPSSLTCHLFVRLKGKLPYCGIQGNLLRARDLWLKGIRRTARFPNPFLYQSVAVLAGEMGLTKESRKWFQEATQTFKHGAGRHGIWQAWAQMEARQGDRKSVR